MIIVVPILIFLLILVGLAILVLKVSKRLGYKKIGIGISITMVIVFLFIPFSFIFDGLLFSKSDAIQALLENEVVITDEFEFESKSISGVMDYILEFEIKISELDKKRIIEDLNSSEHKIKNKNSETIGLYSKIPEILEKDTIIFATYETEYHWNIERLSVLKNKYVLVNDFIQISKSENTLEMIRYQ